MAALVAGVQYGLSSLSNFHENKSLIFVKLTDSAQRAIEDYLKNRNKTSLSPTIQFLGNEGQLSFPSSQPSHVSTGFTFSLSSNHDIEGPQGAFECIQQTGPRSLESLGTLPCKMRIQANDDVYETTRHRMAVAEENSKIKCTRVIKANGPDIGRKVKVKATGRAIPPTTTTSSSSMSLSSTMTTTMTTTSTTNVRHRESLSIPTTTSQSSRFNSHSYSSTTTSSSATATPLLSSSSSNLLCKSIGMNSNSSIRTQQDKKLPELMRRPLKERLIHVLALRPYKKPELYDRITREGIKERDRSTMTTILKQVAFMRDNTYHLHRHVWNDVQEDWPFYNEQDRAMLKRRKPQNLTPPGSSDGSSGSGQSPNSTHPGSPPAITAPPASLLNSKRPGYYQGNDGLQTKRPRISHYRKPEPTTKASVTSGNNSNNNCISNANSGHGSNGNSNTSNTNMINPIEITNWDQQQQQNRQQQRDRTDHRIERAERNERIDRIERTTNSDALHSSHTTVAKSYLSPTSNCDENVSNNTNNNKNNGIRHGKTSCSSSSSASTAAAAAIMTAHNNTASTHSHNNMQSVTITSRHSSNIINGNDKVSAIGYSGNSIGAGVNDHLRSVGGSNNNINNNNNNKSSSGSSGSNSGGGCNSGSNSANNGGNNEGYGTSSCNGENVEIKRVVNDSRDERHTKDERKNDRERGSDKERRELLKENIGSAISGSNSHKHNHDSTMSLCASNNYIGGSGNDASSTTAITITNTTTMTTASPTVMNNNTKTSEYPDYLTQYTAINSTEQRRRYKAEFNSDYEEYRRLHTQVAKVSRRFAQLEERRQKELENGNFTKCEELREQIVSEYISTKNDPSHIETKRRFHYLHEKLSHIKRLVLEYDTQHFGVTTSGGMSNNCDDILSGGGDFRY